MILHRVLCYDSWTETWLDGHCVCGLHDAGGGALFSHLIVTIMMLMTTIVIMMAPMIVMVRFASRAAAIR